jgi:hypothetical protein
LVSFMQKRMKKNQAALMIENISHVLPYGSQSFKKYGDVSEMTKVQNQLTTVPTLVALSLQISLM